MDYEIDHGLILIFAKYQLTTTFSFDENVSQIYYYQTVITHVKMPYINFISHKCEMYYIHLELNVTDDIFLYKLLLIYFCFSAHNNA